MSYVILQLALSLDGYIAREDGSVDFLKNINPDFTETFERFVSSIDTIVMGRKTYQKMLEYGDVPFKDKTIYVLTTKDMTASESNIIFVDDNVNNFMKKAMGKMWLFGGANVIRQFVNADLIDEMQLYIVPQILGKGIPLFLENNGLDNLTLKEAKAYGNDVFLQYKK